MSDNPFAEIGSAIKDIGEKIGDGAKDAAKKVADEAKDIGHTVAEKAGDMIDAFKDKDHKHKEKD